MERAGISGSGVDYETLLQRADGIAPGELFGINRVDKGEQLKGIYTKWFSAHIEERMAVLRKDFSEWLYSSVPLRWADDAGDGPVFTPGGPTESFLEQGQRERETYVPGNMQVAETNNGPSVLGGVQMSMDDAFEVRFPCHPTDDNDYKQQLADDAMYNLRLGILNLVNSNVAHPYWDKLMKELEEAAYKLGEQERKARAKDVVNAILKGFDAGEESTIPHTVPCPASVKIPQAPKMPVFGTLYCEVCNEPNEFAEPNMPNGKYRCYGHR